MATTKKKRMTKAELYAAMADKTGLTKKQVQEFFDVLRDIARKELGSRGPKQFVIPDLVKLEVKKVAARKARKGRNPQTGEEITIPAKPAHNKVKAAPVKKFTEMVK